MSENIKNIIVIGASAAGLRCASRLSRLQPGWNINVIEKNETFSYAACGLPYVLSGDIEEAAALRKTGDGMLRDADYFKNIKGIDVVSGCEVTGIDVKEQELIVTGADGEKRFPWDELVLATGARPCKLPGQPIHPRVFSFHSMDDLIPLKQGLERGEIDRVIMVGAGFVGCELSEAFAALWGANVVLVEAADSILPGILDEEVSAVALQTLASNGVEVHLSSTVDKIEPVDDEVTVFAGSESFKGDVVVVAFGVEPVVELAREAGVSVGATGGISVNDQLATSVPHIWAAGDCIEAEHMVTSKPVRIPLGSLANRQGRTLANILAGKKDNFPPVSGAMAIKVFDTNVAAVGLSRKTAEAAGLNVKSAWICGHDTADYWPESKEIVLQIIYEEGSNRVLGVQAAGEGEVAKRIDVASQLIARKALLDEFSKIEHAYAPPYSPAIDPLAIASFVAINQEDGVVSVSPLELLTGKKVLDVRHDDEREERPAPADQLTAVPLEDLRARIGEVDTETELVICERGARSAEAVRILQEKGISARYMGGGLRWLGLAGKLKP